MEFKALPVAGVMQPAVDMHVATPIREPRDDELTRVPALLVPLM